MVQTVHLTHPIYFQFYPFHHFPFSEMSPSQPVLPRSSTAYPSDVSSFTCISGRCCLQYTSVLQPGIIFQAINRLLFFYIPEQKGPLLLVNVVKHAITTPRIRSFCTFYARQTIINCILRHYSPTVYYLLQCWFSIRELVLLEMCNQV